MEAKINKSAFIAAGIYVILGFVMVFFPETTMKTFCLVLGTIGVVLGMVNLVSYFSRDVMDSVYKYDFAGGIIMILAGIVFIVKMEKILELIPMILGVLIIASGLIKLQHSIDLKRIEFNGWIYVLVFSLLCLSVGAVCVLQPDFIASTLVIILGISFLFCGITDLVTLFFLSGRMKTVSKGSEEVRVDDVCAEKEGMDIKKWFPWVKKDKGSDEVADIAQNEEQGKEPEDLTGEEALNSVDIFEDSVTFSEPISETVEENREIEPEATEISTENKDGEYFETV